MGQTVAAYGPGAAPPGQNPLGVQVAAGGGGYFTYEGMPLFQDHFKSGRFNTSFTASVAATGIMTVTATNVNGIGAGAWTRVAGVRAIIVSQLTPTGGEVAGGIGRYQLNTRTAEASLAGRYCSQSRFSTLDAAGWPTTDFARLISQVKNQLPWMIGGAFQCGFKSRGSGTETITATSGGVVSNRAYDPVSKIVSFDFTANIGIPMSPLGYSVTGTTGGATECFEWLPAYRKSPAAYSATPNYTAEAIAHFGKFHHARNSWMSEAWMDAGEQWAFAAPVAAGVLTATLAFPWDRPAGTYPFLFTCVVGGVIDVRDVTIAVGDTVINWTGVLTLAATGVSVPNMAANRHTPANTKTLGEWEGSGLSCEGFPAEWHIDLCVQAGCSPYSHLPTNADATYLADFFTMSAARLLPYPNLEQHIEPGNEVWNGGYYNGSSAVANAKAAKAGLSVTNWMATFYHAIAGAARTAYGTTKFNSNVFIHAAWQAGVIGFWYNVCNYYTAQGWSPSADLKFASAAPYMLTSYANFTASIDGTTGIMTVSNAPYSQIGPMTNLTGPNIPLSPVPVINAQLPGGTPFGAGTYQTSYRGANIASGAVTCRMDANTSVANLLAHMLIMAKHAVAYAKMENMAVIAIANGLRTATYESGWPVNSEVLPVTFQPWLVNLAAALKDPGFVPVMNAYYTTGFNALLTFMTIFDGGVAGDSAGMLGIGSSFGDQYPPTAANSPRLAAAQNYFAGQPPPTRNVVGGAIGSVSVIDGAQWADSEAGSTALGDFQFGSYTFMPNYTAAGYVPYGLNVINFGTYDIDVTFVNVVGTVTTDVNVNGTVIASAVAVAAGVGPTVVHVASAAALNLSECFCLLGKNGAQTAQVKSIAFTRIS